MKFLPRQGNWRTINDTVRHLQTTILNAQGFFFFLSLSKQPLINKSLDLPMGSYVKEILAANAMVTIVITGKNQNKQTKKNNTLTQEIRL